VYSLYHIASVIRAAIAGPDRQVEHLLLDSRKIQSSDSSLFFALKGPHRDGHQFIADLYENGVRAFVIETPVAPAVFPEATFLTVTNTLAALQEVAAWHRSRFNIPVIGITGSNGKTIVKEWLYQLLHEDQSIVRSPKSYNSQIGVPLSIWQINTTHTLGIFEAGISQPGEMAALETMIRPTIGILTNIGEAHSEGFASATEKAVEKTKLFAHCTSLIFCRDHLPDDFDPEITHIENHQRDDISFYHWSRRSVVWLTVTSIDKQDGHTTLTAEVMEQTIRIQIPFTDEAAIENAITCWCTLLAMGYDNEMIRRRMTTLQPVNMRLELKKGINQCTIINDSYSADLNSLQIALGFLDQQNSRYKRTVILSDFLQTAESDGSLYGHIIADLYKHNVSRLVGIGERIGQALRQVPPTEKLVIELYTTTDEFIQRFLSSRFREEIILVKGARVFGFEQIVQLLEQKVHQTVLEINLNAIVHNVKVYQQLLRPGVKLMAMVKAFAYGSGGAEIAGILQYHKVDYLGVAYADEGVELRKAGIALPIMVMNPEPSTFEAIVEHNLEPDLYSMEMLTAFSSFLEQEGLQRYPVHIEIETGMNRLGFPVAAAEELASVLRQSSLLQVQSVFSHLAASEDPAEDAFTLQQYERYSNVVAVLQEKLTYTFIRHISNTAAISRLPQLQLDMVRLGIGMYGIDSAATHQSQLEQAGTLKTTIAQVKQLKAGESVSYNRRGIVHRDSLIATVRIGYADGYSRRLGNGVGHIGVRGRLAPVIGTVCMDMTMIDVTDIPGVTEGDDAIIFGKQIPVQQLAHWAGTIPYEIMTGISQRVKRVYFEE